MTSPLSGVRVHESGDGLTVRFAGRLMRTLGAEVARVEVPPPPHCGPAARALLEYLDDGKLSASSETVPQGAHVWLDERSPSEIERDLGSLDASLPLVHVAITPFGMTGPLRDARATGIAASALGGFLHICGDENGPPLKNGGYLVEFQTGLFAVLGALTGLLKAEAGGGGSRLETSLFESVVAFQERADIAWTHQGEDWRRRRRHEVGHPFMIFECADGFVSLAVGTPRHWQNLCLLIGKPEWGEDIDLMMNRLANADMIDEALKPWLLKRGSADIVQACQQLFIPCGPVLTATDVLNDAHLRERDFFDLFRATTASLSVPGTPFRSDWAAASSAATEAGR